MTRSEVWYSLVVTSHEVAERLIGHRAVKLGARWCRPEEWVKLPTCFKCQRTGHKATECKVKGDINKICYKCGSTEHLVKECTAVKATCRTCNKEGHRADSMACPSYREAVKKYKENNFFKNRGLIGKTPENFTMIGFGGAKPK